MSDVLEPEELIVEGKYFLYREIGNDTVKELKTLISKQMAREGYLPDEEINPYFPEFADASRSIKFRLDLEQSAANLGIGLKIKNLLNIISDKEFTDKRYFERLKSIRNDLPFTIEIKFKTIPSEDREGYEVNVTAVPSILQKRRQGVISEIPRKRVGDVVNTTKQVVSRVMSNFEAEPLLEPQTRKEVIQSSLDSDKRAALEKLEYGGKVTTHVDEGNACYRENLLHSALSSYVHSIEWLIICYLNKENDIDIIEEEKDEGDYYYFKELVEELDNTADISQKTMSKLKTMNSAERRWIAHHKTGNIAKSDVINVKERLEILVDELL
ncbi:hypothetical protein ACK3SF_03955 [Candidatus Nanosalina sp. VS9-1]|uniref:hypothetical protein n=1 Tax=Candidatus Nanosalina sp. VS9-1 TaxID=3388566 RepID=UPI0039E0E54A